MPLLPDSKIGKVEFYEAHIAPWTTNATAIGLTAAQVTALAGEVSKARSAYNAHVAALDASKAATEAFYNCVADMQNDGADAIRAIKNKAETTEDPNVYVLAQIPAPLPPSATPPPGTPANFRVELMESGALSLSWKCANPAGTSGTIYEVKRRVGGSTASFVYVGATGEKKFVDDTLPVGSSSVTYQITAIRSTASGNPARFTVAFGVGGDGFAITTESAEFATRGAGYSVEIPQPGNGNGNGSHGNGATRLGKNGKGRMVTR